MAREVTLPPNVLLAAKLLAVWLLVHRGPIRVPESQLPLLRVFDRLGPATGALEAAMAIVFVVFVTALRLDRMPRPSAFVLGLMVLLGIAMNRKTFANNATLAGCLPILIGVHDARWGNGNLRAQLALVYGGGRGSTSSWTRTGAAGRSWSSGRWRSWGWTGSGPSPTSSLRASSSSPWFLLAMRLLWQPLPGFLRRAVTLVGLD